MFKDNSNIKKYDSEVIHTKLMSGDTKNLSMTGQITDKIYRNGVLVETIEGHNLVVNSFLKLVMCMLKNDENTAGIQYWAVGSGEASWDNERPDPRLEEEQLTNEIGRKAISNTNITFLDGEFNEVSTPTNILQVKHTFGANDCNGVWREFGIFGGNATAEADSGIMINKRHHAIITKTEEMTIERIMRFTLTLV